MTTSEFPEDQPVSFSPIFVPDNFVEAERRAHGNSLVDLNLALGRTAQVSSGTWPRSLHVIKLEESEVLIRSVVIKVGRRVGECINITVNDSKRMGAYSESEIDIHDFVIPCSFNGVSYRSTRTHRNSDNAWEVQSETGPILQKRHDKLEECYGKDYTLPAVRRVADNKKVTLDMINESLAAERLIGWLSLCSRTSYEEYISREI